MKNLRLASSFQFPVSEKTGWKRSGFSLIEILVAVSVLVILGALIAQLTNATSNTTRISNRSVDAAAQARLVFDRIGLDLNKAVLREDSDFQADNAGGNGGKFDFLSEVASADPASPAPGFRNRGCSRIIYRMEKRAENGGRLCLLRGARAVDWADAGFLGLKTDGFPVRFSDAAYPVAVVPEDFDVLSPAVLRMVVGFQLSPDNEEVILADGSTVAQARGQIVYSPPVRGAITPLNSLFDSSRVSSLVVGLVVLDLDTLKLLNETTADLLAAAFPVSVPQGARPVGYWMNQTSGLAALPDAIPLPARQAVRLYQRFYPISPNGSRVL